MDMELNRIRAFRLRAHHLDKRYPVACLTDAAGVCGLQNSPPGAWETAAFNRLEGCTLSLLQEALYEEKSLLQAWSFRGAPVVFPTRQSGVFLTALTARDGEQPWIYTAGIAAALEFLQLPFDWLLAQTQQAAAALDHITVKSKEALDQTLADLVEPKLPTEKQALWRAPSMYGSPDRQTVGGAVVSFLLRPCAFSSLVVFGKRQGVSPTFTSFRNWTGQAPEEWPDAERALTRKFLHCYGPATAEFYMRWLGCSRKQARRLWEAAADEMEPVRVEGKTRFILSEDREAMLHAEDCEDRMVLLGAHDPYLDVKDRDVLLEEPSLHQTVWKTVGNPGAVLRGGRIVGTWKANVQREKLDVTIRPFRPLPAPDRKRLEELAEEYAAFRQLGVKRCTVEND